MAETTLLCSCGRDYCKRSVTLDPGRGRFVARSPYAEFTGQRYQVLFDGSVNFYSYQAQPGEPGLVPGLNLDLTPGDRAILRAQLPGGEIEGERPQATQARLF